MNAQRNDLSRLVPSQLQRHVVCLALHRQVAVSLPQWDEARNIWNGDFDEWMMMRRHRERSG
jgi:hypothetical protein